MESLGIQREDTSGLECNINTGEWMGADGNPTSESINCNDGETDC